VTDVTTNMSFTLRSTNSKTLSALLCSIEHVDSNDEVTIRGLCFDNRRVNPGDLFFAIPGASHDARAFIPDAISRGASAVIAEAGGDLPTNASVPIIEVTELKKHLSEIAARFYEFPANDLHLIGVTGTNGKTTCCYALASLLKNEFCAHIGTLGAGFIDDLQPTGFTTPDAIQLQQTLSFLRENHARYVAIEVSSHALAEHRVAAVPIETAIFTNLTQDHLDYHGTMEAYANAKMQLFTRDGLQHAIINADDPLVDTLEKRIASDVAVYRYSLHDSNSACYLTDLVLSHEGIKASVVTPFGGGELVSPLLGRFNASNLLAVLTAMLCLGVDIEEALARIHHFTGPPGRMQRATFADKHVVVDYAHTPDALLQVLTTLREHCTGELTCVVGCGGNRDQKKRAPMGRIGETHADRLILTNDNPRFEAPEAIINDMLAGLKDPKRATVIFDRKEAIGHAFACAKPGDMILIAGRGHECYQEIAGRKFPFSDIDTIAKFASES